MRSYIDTLVITYDEIVNASKTVSINFIDKNVTYKIAHYIFYTFFSNHSRITIITDINYCY